MRKYVQEVHFSNQ